MVALARTIVKPAPLRRLWRHDWTPELLLAPALVAIAVVVGFPPSLPYLHMSVHKWSLIGYAAPAFIGAGNFTALVGDDRFVQSLLRTLYFTAAGLATNLPPGSASRSCSTASSSAATYCARC